MDKKSSNSFSGSNLLQRLDKRPKAVAFFLTIVLLLMIFVSGSHLPVYSPIDFIHYKAATAMLLQGEDPYSVIEFFFPPWAVILLGPFSMFPIRFARWIWLILLSTGQAMTGALALRWHGESEPAHIRTLALSLSVLMPSALFSFVTGQITPLVGLSALLALSLVTRESPNRVALCASIALVTIKPHIVTVPAILVFLHLIRRRKSNELLLLMLLLLGLAGIGFLILPNWPSSLVEALLRGAYFGGEGLVAPGYRGLRQTGVPFWLFLPALGYTLLVWGREGLSGRTVSLALTASLLLAPYTRSYDHAILAFPAATALVEARNGQRIGPLIILGAVIFLPLTQAWMLTPVVAFIGIILLPGKRNGGPNGLDAPNNSLERTEDAGRLTNEGIL